MKHINEPDEESMKKRRKIKNTKKLHGFEWFQSIGSPRYMLAPMVNAGELSYRVLCKNHNTQLLYTQMINARNFVESRKYRKREFKSDVKDSPLVIQLSGDDPDNVHKAVILALKMEDRWVEQGVIPERNLVAISLNLGCPQKIAQRGHYGSFLMEEPELIERIVTKIARDESIRIPISCKIRIFPKWEDTEAYVKMIVRAGATMLVVHGRTRKQKGEGECDLEAVKRIKKMVHGIPVILNGVSKDLETKEDVDRFLAESGCDGIMVANALLLTPDIFETRSVETQRLYEERFKGVCPVIPRRQFDLCLEYLDIIRKLRDPVTPAAMKGHIFKLVFPEFEKNKALRGMFSTEVSKVKTAEEVVKELRYRTMYNLNEVNDKGVVVVRNPDQKKYSDTFSEEMRKKYEEFKKAVENKMDARRRRKKIGKIRRKKKKRREDMSVLDSEEEEEVEGEGV